MVGAISPAIVTETGDLAPTTEEAELTALVAAARNGDNAAWTRLIARYDRTLRAIVHSYRLGAADVDDVVQITWTRMYQNIDRLRQPAAITGWLATTAKREALRVLRSSAREQPSDDPELGDAATGDRPESALLAAEERLLLGRALATLPGRQRQLITLLATQPEVNYQQISATLEMPLGSIGPIRARGLARLGRNPELRSHCLAGA